MLSWTFWRFAALTRAFETESIAPVAASTAIEKTAMATTISRRVKPTRFRANAKCKMSPHHPERSEVRVRDPALPRTSLRVPPRRPFGRCGILANFTLPSVAEVAGQHAKFRCRFATDFRLTLFEFCIDFYLQLYIRSVSSTVRATPR